MTREEAKEILLSGELIHYNSWTFSELFMSCCGGCCDTDFYDVEETLDHLELFCSGDWEDVS